MYTVDVQEPTALHAGHVRAARVPMGRRSPIAPQPDRPTVRFDSWKVPPVDCDWSMKAYDGDADMARGGKYVRPPGKVCTGDAIVCRFTTSVLCGRPFAIGAFAAVATLCCCSDVSTSGQATGIASLEAQIKQHLPRMMAATVAFADGSGSGVVVDASGYVVTAAHVYRGDAEGDVSLVMTDGRELLARWVGRDEIADIGVLRVINAGELAFVELAPGGRPARGAWCVSLGHPFGYMPERPLAVLRLGRIQHASPIRIITDCAIRSGDSGGPTFDMSGRLIGIHSQIANANCDNWDVPVERVLRAWKSLEATRATQAREWHQEQLCRRICGVVLSPDENLCARVAGIDSGSPADLGGLRTGDVITELDGEAVTHQDHFVNLVEDRLHGEVVRVQVTRGGEIMDLRFVSRRIDEPTSLAIQAGRSRAWRALDTRQRPIGRFEKESASEVAELSQVCDVARRGIVGVFAGEGRVGQGLVVDDGRAVVTKGSVLKGATNVRCVFSDGSESPATMAAASDAHDLVVLHLDEQRPWIVPWSQTPPELGEMVFVAEPNGRVVGLGVVGTPAGSFANRSHFGVSVQQQGADLVVTSVLEGSTAMETGMKSGDFVLAFGISKVRRAVELANAIGKTTPGEGITVRFRRGGAEMEAAGVMRSMAVPDWFRAQEIRLGAVPSERMSGFPIVIQHDVALLPEHCGGPLLDLDGRVIGLNIARHGRVETFAIPSNVVISIVADLLKR